MSQSKYLAALNHHRAGQLVQAESLYQKALSMQPGHADALHMLGVVYYQTGRAQQAVDSISQALAINPKNTDYLNHYGLALRARQSARGSNQKLSTGGFAATQRHGYSDKSGKHATYARSF